MNFVFDPPPRAAVAVRGGGLFPVRRIFCIGRNYGAHVREMGGDPKKDPPVFFTKPADAVTPSGAVIPYPQVTEEFHYEGELVVALKSGGRELRPENAGSAIYGYAAGCDLTRRDLQTAARKAGGPWDVSKGFDHSAALGDIVRAGDLSRTGLGAMRLSTTVNGAQRQCAPLSDMIWSVPEILQELSKLFELKAGDLIFTGTPEGVGPLKPGDAVRVEVGDLPALEFRISERA